MGGNDATRAFLEELTGRLRARVEGLHRVLERGLRRVLDESASPSCCSVEKVAHIRTLLSPTGGESPPPGAHPEPEGPKIR
jgi:hypothetical protein